MVVQGPRGVEVGDVLACANARFTGSSAPRDGEVVRSVSAEDDACSDQLHFRGQELLARAADRCEQLGLPLAFVDVEVTLDRTAILHALPWGECDATAVLDELSQHSGLTVRLLDLSRGPRTETAPSTGCGKPGCGSESGSGGCSSCGAGGGCSTGSCSRGAVKSADELTAYFGDLRRKMEEAGMVRTPLN